MEKPLKCVFMLSLKEIILRRVAALLSSDYEMSDPKYHRKSWQNNEDKVIYKISKLLLPESLRNAMIDKVRPLGLEIRKWLSKHHWIQISTKEIVFEKLFWTSAGTIDYKKTAEALLGCEELDVAERYRLACNYCVEDYIPLHWDELAEDKKKYFLSETSFRPFLIVCWPSIFKGEFSYRDRLWITSDRNLTSYNQWAFEESAGEENKTAAEYFFSKLTHEEREVSVMRATIFLLSYYPSGGYFRSRVLFYLLSSMNPEQQMEVIEEHPVDILLCFFVMSWQDLLVENAEFIWSFLPASDFGELLKKILDIVKSDDYHPKSFGDFFIMSPLEFKKYFVHGYGELGNPAYRLLKEFFEKEDSESVECIFRTLDAADRAAIVFNPDVFELFCRCYMTRTDMVKVCLREAKLSREDRERLKIICPDFKRDIVELYGSDATPEKAKKGQKRKLDCSSE